MNLKKKRALAARTLGVGKGRIIFNFARLNEIKEAITKQDIRDLVASNGIMIAPIKGRKKVERRQTRRRAGRIRKKVRHSKQEYVRHIRKSRAYIQELREHKKLSEEGYWKLRKELKAGIHPTKHHIKERVSQL